MIWNQRMEQVVKDFKAMNKYEQTVKDFMANEQN